MPKLTKAIKLKWEGYSFRELRNMLVRLGTKHPEEYGSRNEMIEVLNVVTREVADPDWKEMSDAEMRSLLSKLGIEDQREELTRPDMVTKLETYTELAG
jgi:hypothetical protein